MSDMLKIDSADLTAAKCDKYDYLIAAFCGVAAGLVDVIFVRDPKTGSPLGDNAGKTADDFVQKAAEFFYKGDKREQGKPKKAPDSLQKSISYLEQAFPVNYDARYAKDLKNTGDALKGMNSSNHHLMSLGHSPDFIGLVFSIIDQFNGTATFVDKGRIVTFEPAKKNGSIPYLQGTTFYSKLFCGFINWIGHLISDFVGSSSTRESQKNGRGMGIPIPFYELFIFCDFGDIDGNTIADTMRKVYEEGYDARFGMALAVPVLMEELMVRCLWIIKKKFFHQCPWKECIPTSKHADLRMMLIVGNSALCIVDGVDATVHGIKKMNKEKPAMSFAVNFALRLNFIGWSRLVLLIFKELAIRLGVTLTTEENGFASATMGHISSDEQERLNVMVNSITEYAQYLQAFEQLKMAIRENLEMTEERLRIEEECRQAVERIENCRIQFASSVEDYLVNHMEAYEEGLSMMEDAIYRNDSNAYITGNNIILKTLGGESQFSNQNEFDDLMSSELDFKF